MHECDRQTDHAAEKCVGIGGIVRAARVIPPKEHLCVYLMMTMSVVTANDWSPDDNDKVKKSKVRLYYSAL